MPGIRKVRWAKVVLKLVDIIRNEASIRMSKCKRYYQLFLLLNYFRDLRTSSDNQYLELDFHPAEIRH